ncbi:MAG: hypothetical protein V7L23_19375 [Nostoc sp.]|uniref:hypothetical protein n=1 Tax=Nostoc sp. TaxID=1180 RepID=UPI002FF41E82
MLIGVNLSSNAYPTSVLPHPNPTPRHRGGVTRRVMVSEISSRYQEKSELTLNLTSKEGNKPISQAGWGIY